jgi:hypothetical protein
MFSLIITIFAIVLVTLLALATLYYGSSSFGKNFTQATISQYLTEGQQVQGAIELYKSDKSELPTGTNEEIQQKLIDGKYLKAWPGGSWELRNDLAVRSDLSVGACTALNAKLSITEIPVCGDPAYSGRSVCCSTL